MCRFAVYSGAPVPLSRLVYDAPRGLSRLAWDPREMQHGHVNVDGTGVAWWHPDEPDEPPLRYVTTATPWNDANLPQLLPRLRSHLAIGAVRAATPGIPFGPGNVAPFTHEGIAFAHNGWIGGYRKGTGRELLRRLPDDLFGAQDAVSDSQTLFLTVLAHLRSQVASDLADAVMAALSTVAEVCRDAGEQATLNVACSDGTAVVLARASLGLPGNSLYAAQGTAQLPAGIVVASEPLDDDPAWEPVGDRTLLVIADGRITTRPLELDA